jgi:enamine deaminase RidA (YjgF/YER057c/UK114 family)
MPLFAAKLAELGIVLPKPAVPLAAYVPYVVTGNLAIISGQLPLENGAVKYTGRLEAGMDLADGMAAARLCAVNILAQLQMACDGDLGRVERCVRLGGFVASSPDFFDQPKIVNGASALLLAVFGDAGRHARAAVGVAALPMNASVEVEAMFSLRA